MSRLVGLTKSLTPEIGNTLKYIKRKCAMLRMYLKDHQSSMIQVPEKFSDANNRPEIRKKHLINFWWSLFHFVLFLWGWGEVGGGWGSIWLCHQIGEMILERLLQWRLEFSVPVTFYIFHILCVNRICDFLLLWLFTVCFSLSYLFVACCVLAVSLHNSFC